MADQFPSIKPTDRSFRLAQYPVKTYRSLSGATLKRSFGDRAYGYELQLSFVNIKDDIVDLIINHYYGTRGGFERFTLPDAIFAGMSTTLKSKIQAPTAIKWEYSSSPDIKSVFKGISTVNVTLAGEIEF